MVENITDQTEDVRSGDERSRETGRGVEEAKGGERSERAKCPSAIERDLYGWMGRRKGGW